MSPGRRRIACIAVLLALLAAGCRTAPDRMPPPAAAHGDPAAGRELIEGYGCGHCHTIPGIRGADGLAAVPLDDVADRAYIAGTIPNKFDNLVGWIHSPQEVDPGNAMPNLGLTEEEAGHVAAYLLSLRHPGGGQR